MVAAFGIMALCAGGGLVTGFAAFHTMYSETAHWTARAAVVVFSIGVFLGFVLLIGLGGVLALYE